MENKETEVNITTKKPDNIKINDNINNYNEDLKNEIYEYLNSFNEINIKAYNIASNHLGSSFNIVKSNGFIEWKKQKK